MAIYRLLKDEVANNVTFDSRLLDAMCAAFEKVCDDLGLNRRQDRITELVAMKIIEAAKAGERDAQKLAALAIGGLGIRKPDGQ